MPTDTNPDTDPRCEVPGCTRAAHARRPIGGPTGDSKAWLCERHMSTSENARRAGSVTSPAKARSSAANGAKSKGRPKGSGKPRLAPDALREAARLIRAGMGPADGTGPAYLEPVAAMLEKLAGGPRPSTGALGVLREARASIALDRDPNCQTLSQCEVPGCDKGTADRFCPQHTPTHNWAHPDSCACNHCMARRAQQYQGT